MRMQLPTSLRTKLEHKTIQLLIYQIVLALLFSGPVRAQVFVVARASIDHQKVSIGDVIELTVEVTYPEEAVVRMPASEVDLGPFELRHHEILAPVQRPDGLLVAKAIYSLSVFQTGELEIPSIQVSYTLPKTKTEGQTRTEPVKVLVETLLTDQESDIRDIKAPLLIPANWLPLFMAALLGGLAVAAAFYLWRRRKRKRALQQQEGITSKRPPDELALEALEQLRRSNLLNRGEIKQYHVEASEIIRRYLEGRFLIDALEMTSGEILESLSIQTLEKEKLQVCESFLSRCDLVKFAKLQPVRARSERSLDLAFDIVNRTQSVKQIQEQPHALGTSGVDSSKASAEVSVLEAEKGGSA